MGEECPRCGTNREPVFCMTCVSEMTEEISRDAARIPQVKALVIRLRQARDAIKSLPENALGMCGDGPDQWPISKELLHFINDALTPFEGVGDG